MQHSDYMVGLFGKLHFLAFKTAWVYLIFHGVLQCMLPMMKLEVFAKTLLSRISAHCLSVNMMVKSCCHKLHLCGLHNISWNWHLLL